MYPAHEFPADFSDDFHCRVTKGATGWFSQTYPVSHIDFSTHQVSTEPQLKDCRGQYAMMGAKQFIDLPGEWAIAADGYLYYWPKKTPIEDQVIVLANLLDIIKIKGRSASTPASHIIIDGLTLSTSDCTKWGLSNKTDAGSFSGNTTANCDDDYSRHALLVLENTEHITVTRSRFLAAGIMGILCNYYSQYNTITGNWIEGVNYHGVCLQSYCQETGPYDYINRNNTVSSNYIYRTGRLWSNGAGIYMHQSGRNLIEYNEVREMPRYGITMKGGFGPSDMTLIKDNMVRNNDVSHCIHSTNDCGLIEGWNFGPNDSIMHNYLHDTYHPARDVRTYNTTQDPAVSTTPEWQNTGGLSHRQPLYPDGHRPSFFYEKHAVSNVVDAKHGYYDQTITPCRSGAIDAADFMNWDEIGLRDDFRWYGRTPATDDLVEEWEFPE
ncbi:MAG: hypothetical protein GF350_07290 [Chitinivibrionales bacterium]|nr:hypothetical protein [Chitinivibrionales bacterium]